MIGIKIKLIVSTTINFDLNNGQKQQLLRWISKNFLLGL